MNAHDSNETGGRAGVCTSSQEGCAASSKRFGVGRRWVFGSVSRRDNKAWECDWEAALSAAQLSADRSCMATAPVRTSNVWSGLQCTVQCEVVRGTAKRTAWVRSSLACGCGLCETDNCLPAPFFSFSFSSAGGTWTACWGERKSARAARAPPVSICARVDWTRMDSLGAPASHAEEKTKTKRMQNGDVGAAKATRARAYLCALAAAVQYSYGWWRCSARHRLRTAASGIVRVEAVLVRNGNGDSERLTERRGEVRRGEERWGEQKWDVRDTSEVSRARVIAEVEGGSCRLRRTGAERRKWARAIYECEYAARVGRAKREAGGSLLSAAPPPLTSSRRASTARARTRAV